MASAPAAGPTGNSTADTRGLSERPIHRARTSSRSAAGGLPPRLAGSPPPIRSNHIPRDPTARSGLYGEFARRRPAQPLSRNSRALPERRALTPAYAPATISTGFRFFLGTHTVRDLADPRTQHVPLLVSRPRLARIKRRFPRRPDHWAPIAIDSGGFTELSKHGTWTITPAQYVAEIRRAIDGIGAVPQFVAPMDWMSEFDILRKTGLSISEHQRRTLDNYRELVQLAPDLPWLPVLQGWLRSDYLRHADDYARADILLDRLPQVGLGSVCRRQNLLTASLIIDEIADLGVRIHAFGFKTVGLSYSAPRLASADSLAWSFQARNDRPMPGCTHVRCSSCLTYALWWREELLDRLAAAHPHLRLIGRTLPEQP